MPQGLGRLGEDSVFPQDPGMQGLSRQERRGTGGLNPQTFVLGAAKDEESSGICQPKAAFSKLGVPWTIPFTLPR